MTTNGNHSAVTCLDCGSVVIERNRYFTGKYMAPRDFSGEQDYFLNRHRLHNRLLHGWGVVCGLGVIPHPSPDCEDWVIIRSGVAVDCCGRELIVPRDVSFHLELEDEPEDVEAQKPRPEQEPDGEPAPPPWPPLVLCLSYDEVETECVPALYSEDGCDPTRMEANRVREVTQISVRPLEEMPLGCWREPGGGMDAPCRQDCDEDLPGPSYGCIEPSCPCGGCVPIASIAAAEPGADRRYTIDVDGRRRVPLPSDYLTHIAGINWPHGGMLTLDELSSRNGRLKVHFDRPLRPADGDATGVNEFTFVVEHWDVDGDVEFVPYARRTPPGLDADDPCVAVFEIDSRVIDRHERNVEGSSIHIRLRCDFILDCHGNPVSGRHLAGRLPSGDGQPGGVFESWFRVDRR